MIILSIETSCDETALSIVSGDFSNLEPKFQVLSHSLHSQTELHAKYGGVFPVMAKRAHNENLVPLLILALKEAGLDSQSNVAKESVTQKLEIILEREPELLKQFLGSLSKLGKPKIDAIAVTVGPGLEPCLWTGINLAKALAYIWDLPIVPTNHMEGHIFSVLLNRKDEFPISNLQFPNENRTIQFPAVALLISGGHTELVLVNNWGEYKIIGKTRDDAVGEAFDKVARILGLPYPGGPQISILAEEQRKLGGEASKFTLPRPMIHSKDLDFSFSGLKTAVLYAVAEIKEITPEIKRAFALEFEEAVVEVLVSKTRQAIETHSANSLIIGGGVIANTAIRIAMTKLSEDFNIPIFIPSRELSTDNAIMIGIAGLINFNKRKTADPSTIIAQGNLSL